MGSDGGWNANNGDVMRTIDIGRSTHTSGFSGTKSDFGGSGSNSGNSVSLSATRVSQIMNTYATTHRIAVANRRRHVRDSRAIEHDRHAAEGAVAELITSLGFKFFEKLSVAQVRAAVAKISVAKYHAGEYVFRKGASGHHFFCVFGGEVDIILQDGAKPVATLGPGQSFGELALINDAPRAASVRAKSNIILGALSRADFKDIIGQQRALEESTNYAHLKHCVPFCE